MSPTVLVVEEAITALRRSLAARFSGAASASSESRPLSPKVPQGAMCVRVPDHGTGRFTPGLLGRALRYLRREDIDVNFDWRSWAYHNNAFRHLQAWMPLRVWRSAEFRRTLFPDVAVVASVASAICVYNHSIAEKVLLTLDTDGDGEVSSAELREGIDSGVVQAHQVMGTDFFTTGDMLLLQDITPFTLTALALGMMLTFRTQNCNARYTEARNLWGVMINESRALSSRILALSSAQGGQLASPDHAVKCVMTFAHTLKYHLTADGFCPSLHIAPEMSDVEIDDAKCVVLERELASIWDYTVKEERDLVDRILAKGVANRPLHVLHEISTIAASSLGQPQANGGVGLPDIHVNEIYRSLTRLQDVLGACERIYRTPIYTGYTRFSSRCVFLWTNLLPLALYPTMGPFGTTPTSVVVALFLYGLEDVGTRIEEPFDSLPLWQYCDTVDASCKQLLSQNEQHGRLLPE